MFFHSRPLKMLSELDPIVARSGSIGSGREAKNWLEDCGSTPVPDVGMLNPLSSTSVIRGWDGGGGGGSAAPAVVRVVLWDDSDPKCVRIIAASLENRVV